MRRRNLADVPQNLYPDIPAGRGRSVADGGSYAPQSSDVNNYSQVDINQQLDKVGIIGEVETVRRAKMVSYGFSIGDSDINILPVNPNRAYFIIQNNGADDVFISFSSKANINSLKIIPGGNYEPAVTPTSAIHCVSATGTVNTVAVVEGNK